MRARRQLGMVQAQMVKLLSLMSGKSSEKDDSEPNKHLVELLEQLKIAYRQAAEPSYRTLASLAGRGLSASTISRIFNAKKPPKWRNVLKLLTALGVPAADRHTVWYPLWLKTQSKPGSEAADTAQAPLSPNLQQDKICAKCGSSIADPDVHTRWHERLKRAEELLDALERYTKRASRQPARPPSQPATRPPRANGTSNGPPGPVRNSVQ